MHCKTSIESERNQKTGHFTIEQHPHGSRLTILDEANNNAGLQDYTLVTISLILSVWCGEEIQSKANVNKSHLAYHQSFKMFVLNVLL